MGEDVLTWLENWYSSYGDGDWEHDRRIRIETLDNPGWLVDVNLEHTALEDRPFTEVEGTNSDSDWLVCRVRNHVFEGRGGPQNLKVILQVFRDWCEQTRSSST